MENKLLKRHCPSCGVNESINLTMCSTPEAESLNFENIKTYWSGFFKEKIFFSYYRCLCGLLYCPDFFTEDQLAHLYASMSDNTAGVSLEPLIKTQNGYFKFLENLSFSIPKGGYLEFGPDIGLFTENCARKTDFDSYWLFEPNLEVWPTLQKKMHKKACHLFADMKDLDKIPDNSISVVVMIHVLDHLIDPLKVLQNIKQKLVPGAVLLFVTHDEDSLLAKIVKKKWPPYCLQHPQLFNQNSMDNLLKKHA